jgi:ADYC domain-containing protein
VQTIFRVPFLLVLALSAALSARAAGTTVVSIEAVGTGFRAKLSDGSVKQAAEFAGAVLVFKINDQPTRIRIASIRPDPADKSGSVLLHDFRIEATDEPLCSPAPDGTRLGFPLAGLVGPDGRLDQSESGIFQLVCTSGVQGKCVRFGYHPWQTAPNGRPMRDFFNACVRLLRADYCGDGRGWTRDGTLVDIWDDYGVQTLDGGGDPAFLFEAGWNADGAVCAAHSRIPENITLEKLKAYCPRLETIPSCDENSARAARALIFNRSR